MYFRSLYRYLRPMASLRENAFSATANTYSPFLQAARRVGSCTLSVCLIWPFGKSYTFQEQADEMLNTAINLIKLGELTAADKELHQLLSLFASYSKTEKLSPIDIAGKRARIYCEMANLSLMRKDHSSAEKLLKETIKDCVTAGISANDPMIVELSLKLALIYADSNDDAKAELGFDYCVLVQEQNLKNETDSESEPARNNRALLGMVYNYYSKYLSQIGRLSEALKLAEKALKIAQSIYPVHHSNCLHLLGDMAMVSAAQGQSTNARELLSTAVKTANEANGDTLSITDEQASRAAVVDLLSQWAAFEGSEGNLKVAADILKQARSAYSRLSQRYNGRLQIDARLSDVEVLLLNWNELDEDAVVESSSG